MDEAVWRPRFMLVLGAIVLLGIFAKAVLRRFDVPALVGYLAIGVGLAAADRAFLGLPAEAGHALGVLADLGIVCLLFRVGLESDLRVLWRELPRATWVLCSSVALSFALGFFAARLCGLGELPALFAAVALSATSIAVAAFVWEGAGLLRSRLGALVIDVAELDDLAAVFLMVLLFAAVPVLDQPGRPLGALLGPAVLAVLGESLAFGAVCFLFARYLERRLTASFRRLRHGPDPIVILVGVAILVAAFAAWLGFSLAVGALFAGLVFSRDPRAVRLEASFEPVHELLAPFFFVAVGASLDLGALPAAAGLGAALLAAAVLGKVLGSAVALWPTSGLRSGLLVGVSMVPRAEIALFVVESGRRLGPDRVPPELQGAMVLVVAATCLGTPPLLRRMLLADRAGSDEAGGAAGGPA
jgi:Kef-type K+ transport system membrane component KefB